MYQFVENITSDKAFFFYRGSVALYALLKAVGIGQGDEVILQVFTCDVVPAAIVRLAGTPVYVDIDPGTFNINPAKIEEKITKKTKAIIVQHTYGIPAEMDRILDIARKYNLRVIEDSCHALGSKYCGQETGTFGDAAFYSFGWHKPIVLGVGGAAIVNNPTLKQRVAEVYSDFITPSLKELSVLYIRYFLYSLLFKPSLFWSMREVYRKQSGLSLRVATIRHRGARTVQSQKTGDTQSRKAKGSTSSYEKKMIPFQQERLFRKLRDFDSIIAYRRWIVSQYEGFLPRAGFKPIELDNRFEPIYYNYPLLSDRKEDIFEEAPQARIELSRIFVSPLYPHNPRRAAYWRSLGYRKGVCPISEDIADRIVALPVHTRIQAKDIERTFEFLASFLE
jgi:perosamine synthetase